MCTVCHTVHYNIIIVLLVLEFDKDYHDLCTVSVTGTYPTLSVTDVHGEGVASLLSKSQIWKMLQLSRCLFCVPDFSCTCMGLVYMYIMYSMS